MTLSIFNIRRIERRIKLGLVILTLPASFLLASCSEPAEIDGNLTPPAPALWQIENNDGEIEGWLFGTIHSLPDGLEWKTAKLEAAISQSKLLVVEISGLNDGEAVSDVFGELASNSGLPPLDERVELRFRNDLKRLMAKGGYKNGDFTATESWAAALTLAQITAKGDPENGVDRALLSEFFDKPTLELEGARKQLGVFDSLHEDDQRDLLEAIVEEASMTDSAEENELVNVWRSGDMETLAQENSQGLLADPELRTALLTNRNQEWALSLVKLMPKRGPMLIAVGAAHMAGEDGLPALLAQDGFTITRIQ